MGFYQTEVIQNDGSVIVYQHDKPLLADSIIIWKKTVDSFAVSNDGGQTWRGMDSSGNAVTNVLAAIGIVADWISAGTLRGVEIIGTTGSIGGWTIQSGKLISADGTMVLDSNTNTITVNDENGKKFMHIKNGGVTYFRPDENDNMKEIGSIGVTKAANADTYGVTFNLKNGDAMTWSVYNSTTGFYNNVLRYEADNKKFIFNGDLEVNGNLTSVKVNGATPVTDNFIAFKSFITNPDGTIASRQTLELSVINGLIASWRGI
jgi:hypothetical protein